MPQLSNRILLEDEVLRTPGLVLFGRSHSRSAQTPLLPHVHPGCLEMVVVRKGCERYMAGDPSLVHEVHGGEVFLSQVDQIHGTGESEQGISEFYWFQLSLADPEAGFPDAFLGLASAQASGLRVRLRELETGKWLADRAGMHLLEESFLAFLDAAPPDRVLAQALFVAALIRLIRRREAQSDMAVDPRIRRVMTHIAQHVQEPLDIQGLCGVAGLSASSFKRLFVEETGQTPREYVNEQKIEKAQIGRASCRERVYI